MFVGLHFLALDLLFAGSNPFAQVCGDPLGVALTQVSQITTLVDAPPGYVRTTKDDPRLLGAWVQWEGPTGHHQGPCMSIAYSHCHIMEKGSTRVPHDEVEEVFFKPTSVNWIQADEDLLQQIKSHPHVMVAHEDQVVLGRAELTPGPSEALEIHIHAPNGVIHPMDSAHSGRSILLTKEPPPLPEWLKLPTTPVVMRVKPNPPSQVPLPTQSEATLRESGVSEVYTKDLDRWMEKIRWVKKLREGPNPHGHVDELVVDVQEALDYSSKAIANFRDEEEKAKALKILADFEEEAKTRFKQKRVTPTWAAVFHRRLGPLLTQQWERLSPYRKDLVNLFGGQAWMTHEQAMEALAKSEFRELPMVTSHIPNHLPMGTVRETGIIAFNEALVFNSYPAQTKAGRSDLDNTTYFGDQITEHDWIHVDQILRSHGRVDQAVRDWAFTVLRTHIRGLRGEEREEFEFTFFLLARDLPVIYRRFINNPQNTPFEYENESILRGMRSDTDYGPILPSSMKVMNNGDRYDRLRAIGAVFADLLEKNASSRPPTP